MGEPVRIWLFLIIYLMIPICEPLPEEDPDRGWYKVLEKYIKKIASMKHIVQDVKPLSTKSQLTVFSNEIDFHSLLAYGMKDKREFKTTFRLEDSSFTITKENHNVKVIGNDLLKNVLIGLLHYKEWNVNSNIEFKFELTKMKEPDISFTFGISETGTHVKGKITRTTTNKFVFDESTELKEMLEYATLFDLKDKDFIFETQDDSIKITKSKRQGNTESNISEYKIGGNIKLSTVLENLQHYCYLGITHQERTDFLINVNGQEMSFTLQESANRYGPFKQINVITTKGKMPKYDEFMEKLEKKPPKEMANAILDTLKTPLNEQKINNFLGQDIETNRAVFDFILVTHVAEGAVPTDASLETFNKGVKLIQEYEEKIKSKNIPEKDIENIKREKNEELYKLVNKMEKRGRIPLSDKITRIKLDRIAADEANFVQEFSVKNWPLRKKGGTQEGRIYVLTDLYNIDVSDVESEFSETEMKQRIAAKRTREESETEYIDSRLKSKINDLVNDEKQACSKQRRKRSLCGQQIDKERLQLEDIAVLEDSGNIKVKFTLSEKDGSFKNRAEIVLNSNDLHHANFIENMVERGNLHTGPSSIQKANKILGMFGIFAGICAAKREFEDGDKLRGSVFVSQSIYTSSHFTGFDKLAKTLSAKIGSKVLTSIAYKVGLEKTVQRTAEKIASSALARLAGGIPFIGLAFDVFFIEEDIRDLTKINLSNPNDIVMLPLDIIHLGTDVTSTVLNFLGPEMEPLVLALSIFRMTFDYIYTDIYKEMKNVNWNSPWAPIEAYGAFIIGKSKGIADIFTGGLISTMNDFRSQVNSNNQLIQKLSKQSNYYSIDSTGDSQAFDFLKGSASFAGGDITFSLGDDGFAHIKIENVPTINKGRTTIEKKIEIDSKMTNIILGIGESRAFTYSKKTAHLFWLIPVKSYDIICGEKLDKSSLYGTYYGNSKNNKFIAVQEIPDFHTKETDNCATKYGHMDSKEMLQHYHYKLYGNGGKDVFFLGPQTSTVQGGEDEDMYIIQPNNGKAFINNFSHKPSTDVLFLNIIFQELICKRQEDDLWIYRNGNERVKVEKYFTYSSGEHYKHLIFRSKDGVIFHPNCVQETVNCFATALEFSDSMQGRNITLNMSPFEHVISVVGSKVADNIYGNLMDNILDSGGGNDFLQGGGGSDTYLVRNENMKVSDRVFIDNYASDNKNDLLVIEVPYVSITPIKKGNDLQFSCAKSLFVQVVNWFIDDKSGHIAFVSGDHVLFTVAFIDNILTKLPKILDFSSLQNGIKLDMMNNFMTGVTVPKDVLSSVSTVSDTTFDDVISGNSLSNFLSCSGGHDILKGNSGMDKYIMKNECHELTINNYDEHENDDILVLDRIIPISETINEGDNLIISSKHKRITILNWFLNSNYRHLSVHLKDIYVLALPQLKTDLTLYILEWNKDDKFTSKAIDLEMKSTKKLKRLHFKSPKRSYTVWGNALNNYIHLGPSVPGEVQYVEGRSGIDIYDVACGDGQLLVNNFASDKATDHLKIGIFYSDLFITEEKFNLTVRSKKMPDHLAVILINYCKSLNYQHLQVHTTDGVTLQFIGKCGEIIIDVIKIDMSRSDSSRYISLKDDQQTKETKTVYGSLTRGNIVYGNDRINKLVGGNANDDIKGNDGSDWIEGGTGNDVLDGGSDSDLIFGGDGDDEIYGGKDDDVLYPGSGNDIVDGGEGVDTVVFKGDSVNRIGVYINLEKHFGKNADAENDLYISIENAIGTDFDDTLIGNDVDNLLRGYGGEDVLVPMGGNDFLFGGEGRDTFLLTSSSGLKTIDNYAKDKETDVFEIKSSLSRNMCSLRYNMSLYLTFHDYNKSLESLYVTINDWYENSLYQHAEFILMDTTLKASDTFQNLKNEQEITETIENVEITSCLENDMFVISWEFLGYDEYMEQQRDFILAYRDAKDQEYTLVNINQKSEFQLEVRKNYEIRLLYVKCSRVIAFTKPHYVFSFEYMHGYMHLYGNCDYSDSMTNSYFTPPYIPIKRGWLLEWIGKTD